jgi:hypothetical protein
LINYWHANSRVFPLQSQVENVTTATNGLDVVLEQAPQPPSRTRSPFGPFVPPGKMVRANSSISHVDVFKDRSQPPSRAMSEIGPSNDAAQWSDYALPEAQLDFDSASSTSRSKRSKKAVSCTNCYICLERIQGLSVNCPRGVHSAHASCYTEYLGDSTEEDMLFRGVSCGCRPPETEEGKNDGLEMEWPSAFTNGDAKH